MADTVSSIVLLDSADSYVIQLLCRSDGTGESAVKKIDKSTIAGDKDGREPRALDLMEITYQVNGFSYVTLFWDHTSDDVMCVLKGGGFFDYGYHGGLKDPYTAGDTTNGDILLTSTTPAVGASYDILLYFKKRTQ